MAISTTFTLKFAGAAVERGLARVQSAFKSLGGVAARAGKMLLSPFAALTAMLGAGALTAGLLSFVKGSSAAASSVESLTTQFTTLLGSAEAAQKRMEEITEFAAKTPFEIQELAATSKLLEVMGGNLISTGAGLRLVGDAAAMAGQPLQEVGLHIGRVFSALTSGTSAGESVNRLQELGLITGATKLRFEELAAAQKKGKVEVLSGAQALKLLEGVMSKARGGMEALSTTTKGKLSNLRDNLDRLKVSFGKGFNDGFKVALDAANTKLPQLMAKFSEFGKLIGKTIQDAVNGDLTRLFTIGSIIGEAIGGGMKMVFSEAWQEIGNIMTQRKNWITGEVNPDDLRKQEKDRQYLRESMGNEIIDKIRTKYQEAIEMPVTLPKEEKNMPSQWANDPRASFAPQPSYDITVGGKIITVLNSIDRRLAPQP